MSHNNNSDTKLISECESLLAEAGKIKSRLDLYDLRKGDEYAFDNICKQYREWLPKAGRIAEKQYVSFVLSKNQNGDGGTIYLAKAKATMLGDLICIEDDIRSRLIQIKSKTSDASRMIAEFILKEWKSNKELKGMLEIIMLGRTGAMARYVYDNNLGGANPKEKYMPGNLEQLKHLYEVHFKEKLKDSLKKNFSRKFSDIDFDVAYLEAKDELGQIGKSIEVEAENALYDVYIPKEGNYGVRHLKCSEDDLKKTFLDNREGYDLFLRGRSIFARSKRGRGNLVDITVKVQERAFNLLVMFLKYKNKPLDVSELFKKAWAHIDNKPSMPTIKTIKNTYLKRSLTDLRKYFGHLGFIIETAKNSDSIIASGDINFCLIIETNDKDKFTIKA